MYSHASINKEFKKILKDKLEILYEDKYLIAVVKPSGLLTIGTEKEKDKNHSHKETIEKNDEVAIVLQNEHIETKAKLHQGVYYLDFNAVQDLLNDRFYHDVAEGLLLYTTPTEIIRTTVGSDVYTVGDETVNAGFPHASFAPI